MSKRKYTHHHLSIDRVADWLEKLSKKLKKVSKK